MFKKTNKILSAIIILTMIFGVAVQPLYAVGSAEINAVGSAEINAVGNHGIEPYWLHAMTVSLTLGLNSPQININITVTGRTGTTYKNGKVVLEKVIGSKTEPVKEWTGISSNTAVLQFKDTSVTKDSGTTYRLTFTVTTVRNGVTEDITQTREASC